MSLQGDGRRISSAQLVMLLFVARAFNLFTFAPKAGASATGMVNLLSIPLAALVGGSLLLPCLWLHRRSGADLLTAADRIGRPVGALTAACFGGFCVFMAAYSIAHFTGFMTATVYQNAASWVFVFWLAAAAAYAASLGLEALSRMGTLLFLLTLAVAALILVALAPEINLVYLSNPLLGGSKPVVRSVARAVADNAELVLFGLLCGRARAGGGKTICWWLALTALFYEVLSLATLTALGEYAGTRAFPLHTAAAVAQVSVLGRMDLLHILLWVGVAFLRSTLYLYCAGICLRRLCPKLPLGGGAALCGGLAGAGALFLPVEFWGGVAGRMLLPVVVLSAGVPLGLALLTKKKTAPTGKKEVLP